MEVIQVEMKATHDAADKLDYTLDWTDWLPAGDTISASSWAASSGSITSSSHTTTTTRAYFTGGSPGELVKLRNQITTAGGLVKVRHIWIRILP